MYPAARQQGDNRASVHATAPEQVLKEASLQHLFPETYSGSDQSVYTAKFAW